MSAAGLLDELLAVTERQLSAARALDAQALDQSSQERADLLFELEVELQQEELWALSDDEKAALRPRIEALVALEERLAVVVTMVNDSLGQALSGGETTYGRPKGGPKWG
ncbi:MAG: hypothetical protein VX899_00700 [Myxococcota bacterium]|nr:hypothetical protein [Myxococcota bacterium]